MRKLFKYIAIVVLVLLVGFIAFVLNETKDQIHATPQNVAYRLNEYYNAGEMGGFAASVFVGDSVLYKGGIGFADKENDIPYTSAHQQYIASVSKTTIAIAILKAQELGLLSLTDPINNYLPFEVINPSFRDDAITIMHLATQTSSLDYNEPVVESLYRPDSLINTSLAGFMNDYFKDGIYGSVSYTKNQPGTNWNYSNIGSALMAYVIELKSGMTFDAFCKKYIFDVLDLNNTVWIRSQGEATLHSKYYEPDTLGVIREIATSGIALYPARDMITDVTDLTRLCQAIIRKDTRLLTEPSYDQLVSPALNSHKVSGLTVDNNGVMVMLDRNVYGITYPMIGLNGGDNCINTMMWYDPKTELGYVFIGNTGQSEQNKGNHIWLARTLISLGDYHLRTSDDYSFSDRLSFRWHNIKSRVGGLF